ncbi:MAG: FixH family protein [Bacteroidales bacterium]|nr:FixH family protein [Bacteroidales bacterium]
MNIKWNWGTGILVAIIAFMVFIIGLVYFTTLQKYDLVEKDYYPKAIEYQQHIDKEQNSKNLQAKVKVENKGDFIEVCFQPFFKYSDISGQIAFYRPSDQKGDVVGNISLDTANCQRFPVNVLQKGKYIVKIDYEVNGKKYFQEETVYIKMF